MKEQVCSIKQRNALEDLGVDVSKASMCYKFLNGDYELVVNSNYLPIDTSIPTFTVFDMIKMLPKKQCFGYFKLDICITEEGKWKCRYYEENKNYEVFCSESDSMIDAVYGTLVEILKAGKQELF